MLRLGLLAMCMALLSGCGSIGSLNPFASSSDDALPVGDPNATLIPRNTTLLPSPQSVTPEAALRGLIIRVTVVAPTQGYSRARLVPVRRGTPDENGVVSYELRATPPEFTGPPGPVRTRTLLAATFVPDTELDTITGFRIITTGGVVSLGR